MNNKSSGPSIFHVVGGRFLRADDVEQQLPAVVTVEAASTGPVFRRLSGSDRRVLYLVASFTGLRVAELASLTPSSFDLNGNPPTVTVEAGYSKHRREDVLPLHACLVVELRKWLKTRRSAYERLWPGSWTEPVWEDDSCRSGTSWRPL